MTRGMRTIRWYGGTALFLVPLLAIACGEEGASDLRSESPATGSEASPSRSRDRGSLAAMDACELLTLEEIEAATGVTPGPGQVQRPVEGAPPICQWASADGSNTEVAQVLVTVNAYDSFAELESEYEEQIGGAEEDLKEIQGLGDFAAWVGDDQWGVLQIYRGDRMLQVSTSPAEDRDLIATARELGARALPRLGG